MDHSPSLDGGVDVDLKVPLEDFSKTSTTIIRDCLDIRFDIVYQSIRFLFCFVMQ